MFCLEPTTCWLHMQLDLSPPAFLCEPNAMTEARESTPLSCHFQAKEALVSYLFLNRGRFLALSSFLPLYTFCHIEAYW